MPEPSTMTLYRISWNNPPTLDDMRSAKALGKPARSNDPQVVRTWDGISLWDSRGAARAKALRNPWRGNAYIAELVIPVSAFRLEKTFSTGHYTLWGNPGAILECVRHIERV